MNKLRQKIRFEALVPLVAELCSKRDREKGSNVMGDESTFYRATEDKIMAILDGAIKEVTAHDHQNCPLPLTCTGYESALEDVRYAINLTEGEKDG